jgi:catalase
MHRPTTTTDAGIPAASDDHSLTVGPDGPTVMHDHYALQKMAQFNRERVPERVVHAKGGGAHGFFELTQDASAWCRASLFSRVGARTPVFLRFSSVAGELGSPDTVRDPRGFAIKFYTGEGNYDLVGNNTPVFFIRDAIKFSDFIHSQKRMPQTGRRSNDMQWDFWTLQPESAHQVMILMSDRGTPRTWRHMNGYGSHTYLWQNAAGERFWVKYHWKTVQGVECFSDSEARAMTADEPDCHRRDLWETIDAGDVPEWRLEVQIMPFGHAEHYRFNPFDVTKVWPHGDYPGIEVGRLVLDRNPSNYFAEVEQAAFEPSSMVPGIGPSPDKMLMGRMFSYPDAHRYRIGANYQQLPINRPLVPVRSYNADGAMRYEHAGDQPGYAPNSYGGPAADSGAMEPGWDAIGGALVRSPYELHDEDDDFGQAGALYRDVMDEAERERLADNIAGHLSQDVSDDVLTRAIAYCANVDARLGTDVANRVSVHADG